MAADAMLLDAINGCWCYAMMASISSSSFFRSSLFRYGRFYKVIKPRISQHDVFGLDIDMKPLPLTNTTESKKWLHLASYTSSQSWNCYRLFHTNPASCVDVLLKNKQLELVHDGKSTLLNNLWLRHHCWCEVCYDKTINEKNFDISKIDLNVTAKSLRTDGNVLQIEWSDNHKSLHYMDDLVDQCISDNSPSERGKVLKLWDAESINTNMPEAIDYKQYLTDDMFLNTTLQNLLSHGITFIKNVPPTIEDTQRVAERISFIKETLWGKYWLLTSEFKWSHKGYTNDRLNVHNDTTYLSEPAGTILFHSLGDDVEGGVTLLVDAFNVAEKLRIKHPDYYKILSQFPVRHDRILENRMLHASAEGHVLQLCPTSGELVLVRLGPTSLSTKHYHHNDQLDLFYRALSTFIKDLSSPVNEFQIKLHPGLVCIVDNWRVLHGRTPFTGKRSMLGIYLPRDDVYSRYRTLINRNIY
ncbi:trimethyllysine dioxygenase, mitochondrial-like [Glandiceps talaboti]